jgi:hypothetical protein
MAPQLTASRLVCFLWVFIVIWLIRNRPDYPIAYKPRPGDSIDYIIAQKACGVLKRLSQDEGQGELLF